MRAVLAVSLLIGLGRFTVPGHPPTGWSGSYEALAHIWVGVLLAVTLLRWKESEGKASAAVLAALTLLETVMFFAGGHFR